MDDKQPSDNHDFSDFDDLLAEQSEDFDHGLELEAVDDQVATDGAPPTKNSPQPQTDATTEDSDVADLIDEIMGSEASDDPIDAPSTIETNSTKVPDTVVEEALGQEEDDMVSPDTDAPFEDEAVEAIAEPTPDDTVEETGQGEGGRIMDDDELPDIDFPDGGSEAHASQAVDDIIDELESFDDFVIDDDEPAIAPEFSAQAALDPVEQPETPPVVPSQLEDVIAEQPAPASDQWADEAINSATTAEERIIPEQKNESSNQPDPEKEEESMKQSNMIALIAGAVALLASMGGLWLGYSAKAELAQMPVQVGGNGVLTDAKLKAMDEKMGQVDERITKLATRLASFGVMSGGSSDPKVDALDNRTARLEQLISDIKEQIGHLRNTMATKQSRPVAVGNVVKSKPQPKANPKPKPRIKAKPVSAINSGGKWFVNLTSHSNQKSAQRQVQQMKKLGITAQSKQVVVKGSTYFRVRIAGFASKAKSNAFKAMLAKKHHISDSWISNY